MDEDMRNTDSEEKIILHSSSSSLSFLKACFLTPVLFLCHRMELILHLIYFIIIILAQLGKILSSL